MARTTTQASGPKRWDHRGRPRHGLAIPGPNQAGEKRHQVGRVGSWRELRELKSTPIALSLSK